MELQCSVIDVTILTGSGGTAVLQAPMQQAADTPARSRSAL
jgi:hypothetical protein